METLVKLECEQCGVLFDDKQGPLNGVNNKLAVSVSKKYGIQVLGSTKDCLCPDCLIKAEIALRDFFIENEYFRGYEPF